MRVALLCASFLFASGCYLSHDPLGPRPCGSIFCAEGESCCIDCDGGGVCRGPGLPCPDLRCTEDLCRTSFDCDPSDLCEFTPGTCGGAGRCVPRPLACDGDCPGVCGCDGNDYCNECEARGNGQMVSSFGFCGGEDFCPDGTPCGGLCCEDCFGGFECVPSGESCGDIFCPPECFGNDDCSPAEFCRFGSEGCRSVGGCVPRPLGCPGLCDGTCACDGMSYCNECMANAAGVDIQREGTCAPPVCGRGGRECTMGEYCHLGPECGAVDGQSCQPIPEGGCDTVLEPVCGCDGNTYGNACEATLVGVTVRSPGGCPRVARTCHALMRETPGIESGVYTIAPEGAPVRVFCDFTTDGGGWTLVASTRGVPLDDAAGPYHDDLSTLNPARAHPFVWNGMRPGTGGGADVRFTCRAGREPSNRVDLSFYAVDWYREWTTGTDAESCFAENDGAGFDERPARRDNVSGAALAAGTPWSAGYLEGEDTCDSPDDFTVDFRDRGMDSNEFDGTDWGADDNSPKCGDGTLGGRGIWQIWVRER